MSPRKRMGNDPFDSSPVFIEETQSDSKKAPPVKKTSVVKEKAASKSADEAGGILNKLNLAEQNIACQKEEIELLRKELNELKNSINYYKNNPFYYWLRFWFPWFPR
ncbi:MAG: hypothetical protein ABFD18_18395 [Syntrophomonas sp.]